VPALGMEMEMIGNSFQEGFSEEGLKREFIG